MDFLDVLTQKINSENEYPLKLKQGMLDTSDSLVVFPLPGGETIKTYWNRDEIKNLHYEIALKMTDGEQANTLIWQLATSIESLTNLISDDNSFSFFSVKITNAPFSNGIQDAGATTFLMDFTAKLLIKK